MWLFAFLFAFLRHHPLVPKRAFSVAVLGCLPLSLQLSPKKRSVFFSDHMNRTWLHYDYINYMNRDYLQYTSAHSFHLPMKLPKTFHYITTCAVNASCPDDNAEPRHQCSCQNYGQKSSVKKPVRQSRALCAFDVTSVWLHDTTPVDCAAMVFKQKWNRILEALPTPSWAPSHCEFLMRYWFGFDRLAIHCA